MRVAWPIIIGVFTFAAICLFLRFVPLPTFFPYSQSILAAIFGLILYLGLSFMLPDRVLFNQYERLKLAFQALHGLPDQATENALRLSAEAQEHARALDAAASALKPEVAKRVALCADRLADIAKVIFFDPRDGRQYLTLIKRADLLTETVTKHAKLMRAGRAGEDKLATARSSVIAALDAFSGAYEGLVQKKVAADLSDITLSGDVAEQLFTRMKGSHS